MKVIYKSVSKQASREEKLNWILNASEFRSNRDLPFEEAREDLILVLRILNRHCPIVIHRELFKFQKFFKTVIYGKYIPKNCLSRSIIPRIPGSEDEIKEYRIKKIKKDFKFLVAELKRSNRTVEAYITETIIIPNLIDEVRRRRVFGEDIRNYLYEIML